MKEIVGEFNKWKLKEFKKLLHVEFIESNKSMNVLSLKTKNSAILYEMKDKT